MLGVGVLEAGPELEIEETVVGVKVINVDEVDDVESVEGELDDDEDVGGVEVTGGLVEETEDELD